MLKIHKIFEIFFIYYYYFLTCTKLGNFTHLRYFMLLLSNIFIFISLQSFFGRTYNNLSSISECKNNGDCIINKKNRTACKACRLRKCLLVGMSKSGSRYGRRSNWFKIHCLLQEQQQHKSSSSGSVPTSPSGQPNNFTSHNFLTSLCNDPAKHEPHIARSPSDSGASSADPDESNRDGSMESFSVDLKTEKSSLYSPPVFDNFRTNYSPFQYGRTVPSFDLTVPHSIPIATVIYATNTPTPPVSVSSRFEQDEPIDLSFNSRKRRHSRSVSPTIRPTFDIPKPAPLDLTLVRSRPLSG